MFADRDVPLAFIFFPIIGWAGLRFGPRGASTLVLLISVLALAVAGLQVGPFVTFPVAFTQILLFTFLALGSLSGHLLAALMAERDDALERRLLLEEQLRHSQKMEAVGRLAGGIAHDFNNLLTAIIGYTEIVLTSLDPKDERRADAEEIGRAAMRAADLTRQMLAFSRRQVLQPKIINLNTALSKVEPMLRRVIGEDIVMTVTGKAASPYVRVDPGQVEQVVMNLVVNARDAMPQGGRLTVETADAVLDEAARRRSARREARPLRHAVGDRLRHRHAAGSARAHLRAVLHHQGRRQGHRPRPLHRLRHRPSKRRPHLGLERVGPRAPRSAFTCRDSMRRRSRRRDSSVEKMPDGTEHILLVEDDPSVRRLSKELLVRLGYSVTEAASGRAGLALGSDDTRHFDLALCDVILGDMSGPAVAEALARAPPVDSRTLYVWLHRRGDREDRRAR